VVRLAPAVESCFSGVTARALAATGAAEPDGWIRAVLPIESVDHAHKTFLALGAALRFSNHPNFAPRYTATSPARYASVATSR
jgi:hypothetical protein